MSLSREETKYINDQVKSREYIIKEEKANIKYLKDMKSLDEERMTIQINKGNRLPSATLTMEFETDSRWKSIAKEIAVLDKERILRDYDNKIKQSTSNAKNMTEEVKSLKAKLKGK